MAGKPLTDDGSVTVLPLNISLAKYLMPEHFFVDMELHSHEMETAQLMAHASHSGGGRAVREQNKKERNCNSYEF